MPHHGNEEEHIASASQESTGNSQEPVIRDNRKVDPVTGEARHPEGGQSAPGAGTGPASASQDSDGDALAQAEEILNGIEVPAEESVAQGTSAGSTNEEAAELRNDLLRLQAEYVNYRKRVDRDRSVARDQAVAGVLEALVPVLDDVDLARQHGELAGTPFAAIAEKLEATLGRFGWERFGAVGEPFDPQVHEALMHQHSDDVSEPTVSMVMQAGHRVSGRVVRAARVAVTSPDA